MLKPQTCAGAAEKRSCDSGIRNSATQPSSSTRVATSQTASHESSSLVSSNRYLSRSTPAGFTRNSNAVLRSKYESMLTANQSDGEYRSRRVSCPTILSGSLS